MWVTFWGGPVTALLGETYKIFQRMVLGVTLHTISSSPERLWSCSALMPAVHACTHQTRKWAQLQRKKVFKKYVFPHLEKCMLLSWRHPHFLGCTSKEPLYHRKQFHLYCRNYRHSRLTKDNLNNSPPSSHLEQSHWFQRNYTIIIPMRILVWVQNKSLGQETQRPPLSLTHTLLT